MPTPRNYHEFPKPDTESANNPEYTGELSIQNIAKLVRPKGASLEQPVSTVSRVSHRVFNRRTGKMQSADEMASSADLALKADKPTFLTYNPVDERVDGYSSSNNLIHSTQGILGVIGDLFPLVPDTSWQSQTGTWSILDVGDRFELRHATLGLVSQSSIGASPDAVTWPLAAGFSGAPPTFAEVTREKTTGELAVNVLTGQLFTNGEGNITPEWKATALTPEQVTSLLSNSLADKADKNFLTVDQFSVTSLPSAFPDGTSYMPIENGANWGISQGGAVLVTHRQPDGSDGFISAIQIVHNPDGGDLAERVSKNAGDEWTDWVFPLEPAIPLSSFPDSTPFDFIGFYEDFTIRPDGQSVGNGIVAPIVGGDPYQESYNGPPPAPSGGSFVTEGGGFRVPLLSNNYLGSSIYTPNGVLDVTFDLLSFNPANEVNSTAFTFTFKNTPVVTGIGPSPASSSIAPSAGIHINFDSNGKIVATHFQQSTPVTIISQGENSYQWPMRSLGGNSNSVDGGNTRWRVNMRAYGDRLEVTSRGRTIVIQCAAIAENIGAEKTYFYFQTNRTEQPGLPPAAVRNYTRLERMWANAPALSLRAAVGGSYGSVFDGHPHARYPNKIDVRPGNLPLIGNGSNQARIFTRSLFVGGATSTNNVFGRPTYESGGFYVEGKSFHSNLTTSAAPVTFALSLVGAFTNPVASPANASITSPALLGLSDGSGSIGVSPGATIVDELCGTFGANNNPKRIQIRDNTLVFDSGEITQNGGAWRMTIRRASLNTVSNNYFVEFWSETTGTLLVNVPRNTGGLNLPINLFASGVAAGDVTVGFRRAIATQDNN